MFKSLYRLFTFCMLSAAGLFLFGRKFFLAILCLFLFSNFILVQFSFAKPQDRELVEDQILEVRKKIEDESQQLDREKKKKQTIKDDLDRIAKETKSISAKESSLRADIIRLNKGKDVLEGAVERVRVKVEAQTEALNSRLVAMYKLNRRSALLDYFVKSRSADELLRRIRYARRIASADLDKINVLRSLVQNLQRERVSLTDTRSRHEFSIRKLKSLSITLKDRGKKKESLLIEAEQQEKSLAKSLASLKDSADSLQTILAGLMGGSGREKPLTVKLPTGKTFTAIGLASMRGSLPLPVKGQAVQRFGKTRHDEFSDILLKKGVEFRAKPGTTVKVVAPGKVVLSQILPEYGKVVIVDHGRRYYSLYGRLSQPRVKVGENLNLGQTIATVGDLDKKGRNFYFELRYKGKAVDPDKFFAKLKP